MKRFLYIATIILSLCSCTKEDEVSFPLTSLKGCSFSRDYEAVIDIVNNIKIKDNFSEVITFDESTYTISTYRESTNSTSTESGSYTFNSGAQTIDFKDKVVSVIEDPIYKTSTVYRNSGKLQNRILTISYTEKYGVDWISDIHYDTILLYSNK